MNVNCVIIEDEPLAVNVIKNHLSKIKGFVVVETFNNAIEGIEFIQNNNVDLLFLDINLPIIDGLSFLRSLERKPLVIITTAYDSYAVQSFELEVLDYLVKPIPFPRFLKATNKVKNKLQEHTEDRQLGEDFIFVKIDKKKMKKIYLKDILLIESLKDYIKIVTTCNNYVVHQTLSNFTGKLSRHRFIRIHRSYTVAIDKIDIVEGNSLEIGGRRYTIGRSYLGEVKERILDLAQ